jgi:hypothetical protein
MDGGKAMQHVHFFVTQVSWSFQRCAIWKIVIA